MTRLCSEQGAGWARNQGRAPKTKCPEISLRALPLLGSNQDLLIQSPVAQAGISDNLLGNGHFQSIGARIPAVVCPLMPEETRAKLRQ